MSLELYTHAFGGISILHAAGCGWGCTIPLELTCEAFSSDSWPNADQDPHMLLMQLRPSLVDLTGHDVGESFFFGIRSNIPMSMGLKSSSAVSVSAVRFAAIMQDIPLSDSKVVQAATQMQLRAGCTMTGSFDDTWSASGISGAIIRTDSSNPSEPVASVNLGSSMCTVLLRGTRKSTLEKSNFIENRAKFEIARDFLMSGDVRNAMRENAKAVALSTRDKQANEIIDRLFSLDYMANISGSGPAIAVLHDEDQTTHISKILDSYGPTITTKILHDNRKMGALQWA